MNVTEPIINAALLGTAAKESHSERFTGNSGRKLPAAARKRVKDAEDAFYQFSALTFAYSRKPEWNRYLPEKLSP
ncbi:MAG: hypothetical protein ACLUE2_11645 [Bacteroides cellulosilyticus]